MCVLYVDRTSAHTQRCRQSSKESSSEDLCCTLACAEGACPVQYTLGELEDRSERELRIVTFFVPLQPENPVPLRV